MFKLFTFTSALILANLLLVQCEDQTLQYLSKEFINNVRGTCNYLRLPGMFVIQEAVRYTSGKLEPNPNTLAKAVLRYLEFSDGPLDRFNKDSILAGAEFNELCLDKVVRPCKILSNAVEQSGKKLIDLGYDINNPDFVETLDFDIKSVVQQGKICSQIQSTRGLCQNVVSLSRSGSRGF